MNLKTMIRQFCFGWCYLVDGLTMILTFGILNSDLSWTFALYCARKDCKKLVSKTKKEIK